MKGAYFSDETSSMTFYLTKVTYTYLESENVNTLTFAAIPNVGVINNITPYYVAAAVDVTNKILEVGTFNFATDLDKESFGANGTLLRLTAGAGEAFGNGTYISAINGEEIVSNTSGNITTSLKFTNITVNN